MTFQENEPYYKTLEKETNNQEEPNEFTFPFFYSEEGNIVVENENEIINENEEEETSQSEGEDGTTEIIPLRRSNRTPQPTTRLRDFVTYEVKYPIQNYLSYENVTPQYRTYLTSISKENEPNNYEEAIGQLVWCKAMEEELRTLEKNET